MWAQTAVGQNEVYLLSNDNTAIPACVRVCMYGLLSQLLMLPYAVQQAREV